MGNHRELAIKVTARRSCVTAAAPAPEQMQIAWLGGPDQSPSGQAAENQTLPYPE
jgi:hypothetical protein